MHKPRNPNLHSAIKAYVGDALNLILSHGGGPAGLRGRAVPKIKIDERGMSSGWATEVDWTFVVYDREKELHGLDSYSGVATAMQADPIIAKHLGMMVGDGGTMARVDVNASLRAFLINLLLRVNDLAVDASKLDSLYGDFETYFYSDFLKKRAFSPLTGFEMEEDQIELGERFFVRRLSVQEREGLASSAAMVMPFPHFSVGFPTGWEKFALDLSVEVPKIIGEQPPTNVPPGGVGQIASERFQMVVSALRLFKAGAVDITSISTGTIGFDIFGGFGGGMSRVRLPVLAANYTLPGAESPKFVAFWADFQRQYLIQHKRVDLAMRRFNLAYERLLLEDRLIDYAIALEALLLRAEEQQELRFRLALRGSRLLRDEPSERSEVFSRLRAAYGVRSEIVHGGSIPSEVPLGKARVPFHQFVEAIADDVRAIIRKMLELTETMEENQVIASLDEGIVRGDAPSGLSECRS
jgi:hypothetical protein